ncbi:MAG: hypothetical protein Q4D55_11530, partial [Eubacteriales bacterium]|nr:hypothetical protein [Eubacteriales bacterium]
KEAQENLRIAQETAEKNLRSAQREAEENLLSAKREAEENLRSAKEAQANLRIAQETAEENLRFAKREAEEEKYRAWFSLIRQYVSDKNVVLQKFLEQFPTSPADEEKKLLKYWPPAADGDTQPSP